jgi:hypothetical protein
VIALALVGLIVGATIAMHFRVFALIPAIILMLATIAIVGMLHWESGMWIASSMALAATSLQLGFLGGGIILFALREKPEHQIKSGGITRRFPDNRV